MMTDMILSLFIVLVIFGIIIFIYHWQTGNFPGSKMIIEDPPLEHNGLDPKQARFIFFYTSWCPHCKTAMPIWNSFKQTLKNNPVTYGDFQVLFEDVNAESNKSKSALYSIKAYPTFKIETGKKVVEMKLPPTVANFDLFLVSVLGTKISKKTSSK